MLVHLKKILMGCISSRTSDKIRAEDELWSLFSHPQFQVNCRDKYGQTPLILCIRHNNSAMIPKLLCYKDIDVNAEDYTGRTALMYAMEAEPDIDNIKLIRTLALQPSYNVNKLHDMSIHPICSCSVTACTDLMYAIMNKWDDVVDLLLTLPNCDVNVDDSEGQTAMGHVFHRTSYYLESIMSLVVKIVDHHSYRPNQYHEDGTIDITNAARLPRNRPGRDELLAILLSHPGLDVNLRDHTGDTVYEMALADADITLLDQLISQETLDMTVINKADLTGRNALHLALLELTVKEQAAPIVSKHVSNFALNVLKCPEFNVNGKDIQGKSPLLYILNYSSWENISVPMDIVKGILHHPLYRVNQQYFDGYVDLLKAAQKLPSLISIKVIEELLNLDSLNVNVLDNKGTALRYIQSVSSSKKSDNKLKQKLRQLILKLIKHESYQDKNQDLLWAAGNCYWGLVEDLLTLPEINVNSTISACKDVKSNGYIGLSPHKSIIKIPHCVKGMTLLHIACKYADKDLAALCKFLQNEEINVNIQDNEGNTALMYAVKHQGPFVVQGILNHPSECDLSLKNHESQTVHDILASLEEVNKDVKTLLKEFRNTNSDHQVSDVVDGQRLKDRSKSVVDFREIKLIKTMRKATSFDVLDEDDEEFEEPTLASVLRMRRKSSIAINQLYQRKLVGNQSFLCENLSPKEVVQNLLKSQVISAKMGEEILSAETRRHIVLKMMSVLLVSGANTYSHFVSALRLTGQGYIADELEQFDPVESIF